MLESVNRIFVILVLAAVLAGISVSIAVLFLPFGDSLGLEAVASMEREPDFVLLGDDKSIAPDTSPHRLNFTITTPPMEEFDLLYLDVYGEGKHLYQVDCMGDHIFYGESYAGMTRHNCTGYIPYHYNGSGAYLVFATFYSEEGEYVSGPVRVYADWRNYEESFWNISLYLVLGIAAVYLLVVFPLTLAVAYIASRTKHHDQEYTVFSLLNPFRNKKTILQKFNSFLASPYFWMFEIAGIAAILMYMLATAEVWKSGTAFVAFFFSGLLAFIAPFLWCAAWWYADFREREPLRLIITFFLWGMLAALMAIGLNSALGLAMEVAGIGFLGTFLFAPVVEEFYKGSGIALLGEHREFNSIEDGLVYGFVIGMGFSFIEDWIYLLQYPMGSDILSWFFLFMLRSILFSANHGFYTAITGGAIGLLVERGFRAPALGLLAGVPIAAGFHAVHNAGEMLAVLFGAGGVLAYCCLLVPFFDYGGFFILLLLFVWALLRKRPEPGKRFGQSHS
ncbi:PrsW family intramembrane metalloprotease [Candidatus Micrarchaeota archaeon]|nr:PrsW family intramembrane metalloprotease [Candidatus Micrarchaeota archaeon]